MNELNMDRPGSELFPESDPMQYNSYNDVMVDQSVDDPLDTGLKGMLEEAAPAMSDKEFNFKALREEVSKMKEEREYWKGQAEAYSKVPTRQPESKQEDPYASLDWDDGQDVKKAWQSMKQENEDLKYQVKDALKAITTKTQRSNWDDMVTQHVPELTSKNPIFAEMIQNASNPYEAAYLLAELNAKASQTQAPQFPLEQNRNAQRAIHNASKPQTLSSIGGGGQLSSADYYASMSDADFMKIAAKNMANI